MSPSSSQPLAGQQPPIATRDTFPVASSSPKEELWHSDAELGSVFGSVPGSGLAFEFSGGLGNEVGDRHHSSVSNLLLMPPRSGEGARRGHDDDDSYVFDRGEEVEDCGEERRATGAGGNRSEHHGSGALAGDIVERAGRDAGVVVLHSGVVRVEDGKEVGAVPNEEAAEANLPPPNVLI